MKQWPPEEMTYWSTGGLAPGALDRDFPLSEPCA